MCGFYSFLTDTKGNRYAFTKEMREDSLSGKSNLRIDSHASIAQHYFGDSKKEYRYNKFEFSPLTRELKLVKMNLGFDDSELIDIDELLAEVKLAVPQLIMKPIVHPFKDVKFEGVVNEKVLLLLKQWVSVRDSILAYIRDSVCDSVGDSVGDFVCDSVLDSVRWLVFYSIGGSVEDSLWAYASSFFNIDKWKYAEHEIGVNPYQCAIDLWEMGLIPSDNGGKWRLHSHKGIVWSGEIK